MEGFLSDAVLAYRHLLDVMLAPKRPGGEPLDGRQQQLGHVPPQLGLPGR
jgi:hypothetical protein